MADRVEQKSPVIGWSEWRRSGYPELLIGCVRICNWAYFQ